MSQTTEQIQKSDIKDILENSLKGIRPASEDILRLLTIKVDKHEEGPSVQMQKRDDRERRPSSHSNH